jgi:ribonuclease P protein component
LGKSYAHPLLVLVTLKNDLDTTRVAVSAGRTVGKAVVRNRSKRLLREALRSLLPHIASGWDLLLLARKPLPENDYQKVRDVLVQVLARANLFVDESNGERSTTGK